MTADPESAPAAAARWTLVHARRVHTLAGPPTEAFVVFGERVVATGPADHLARRYPVQRTVRLPGVVLPGFNDAHAHPTMTAENLLNVDCSPEAVTNDAELVAALRAAASRTPPGQWVIGSRYDHSKTTGGRIVDRDVLDAAVPGHPVLLIHVAAHWGVLNSAGLARADLQDTTVDVPGGRLDRELDGRLTGVVHEQHLFDIAYPALARGETVVPPSDPAARLAALGRALRMFHDAGITSMCDALCGPEDLALLLAARREGTLTMRTGALLAYPHVEHLLRAGVHDGLGDHRLRLVGIKAFVDGACAGGTCLLDEPYLNSDDHGLQVIDASDLDDLVHQVTGAGLALAVHANGDRAIRLLLDAHENARRAGAPARRHRVEHCSLVDDDILARMRSLRLVAVPFGSYARYHGDKLLGYYGAERLERMFAHRSFLQWGIPVAGASDFPCGPFEPLAAITSCVERTALDGTPIGTSQRIDVAAALRIYTTGSAYATGEEDEKGVLAPGMLADFVELDGDPWDVPAADIARLTVRSTWVGAKQVGGVSDDHGDTARG